MQAPRLRGRTKLPSALALTLTVAVVAAWAGTAAAASKSRPLVESPSQELVLLVDPHEAMSAPSANSVALQLVGARRPITGEQTVLPVLGHKTANGLRWLQVRLPGRPNSGTGWIAQRGTIHAVTRWHVVVDTAARRVIVYEGGRPLRAFDAVVGKPSTPTPAGEFFVEEDVKLGASEVGAPYAIALSARSNVFQEFQGGPGQVALHGLANIGGVPGSAVSHGCVRLDAAAMRWLVARVGPGVPVTITG
jgi:lipoprotein-anchoring transpeptidase ErfK/SrfK